VVARAAAGGHLDPSWKVAFFPWKNKHAGAP